MVSKKIREPIISVLGHVDHGKTTFLDYIRGSVIAAQEAGGITQHIGATEVPFEVIKKICGHLLEKIKLKVELRGLLFVDTPGHEAFTTLRKRGGSVADLAILVVDINEGLKPQSRETIQILKQYKTPFVVAANKIDLISGWIKGKNEEEQPAYVQEEFNKKFYRLITQLSEDGFNPELFSRIEDFAQQLAIVPLSAKNGQGIPELLMVLVGLAQQYLKDELLGEITAPGKGTILEVKETKGLGTTIDAIIYEGVIRKDDNIVLGSREGPIFTKVRALLKSAPLEELKKPKHNLEQVNEVYAASGVKIVAPNLEKAMAGASIYVGGENLRETIERETEEVEIERDDVGLIIRADTIGSLEALVKMLEDKKIPIRMGRVGKVSKQDVIEASVAKAKNKYLGVVLAFNSEILEDARELARDREIKVLYSQVIYKLLEEYEDWIKEEREKEKEEKQKVQVTPAKFKILPGCVFRQSKPAICGVEILAGTLRKGCQVMRQDGKVLGKIKEMQKEKENISEAGKGEEIAIAIEGVTIGRQLNEKDVAYSYLPEETFNDLVKKKEELSEEELSLLREIKGVRENV